MNLKVGQKPDVAPSEHAQSSATSAAKDLSTQFVTLQNMGELGSFGTFRKAPKFSAEELHQRKVEFCATYGIAEDSHLLASALEMKDSMGNEKALCFSSFPEEVVALEEKLQHSIENPDQIFTCAGEGYRRMTLECFLNGASVSLEVPIGSYDSPARMQGIIGSAANQLNDFIASGSLNRLASMSNSDHRITIMGGSGIFCSIAVYPEKIISEGDNVPFVRKCASGWKCTKFIKNAILENIPFDDLLK
ncbi:MAG: hypothetical protein LBJ94_03515 [Puniceicoccales bacterium]|jgi:hypothetical protein|nr:hypothetical protein [Puniceicoccales bacterium]